MTHLHAVNIEDLHIPADRQRKEFPGTAQEELSRSIDKHGLLHPCIIRYEGRTPVLVAGERRIRSMKFLWFQGKGVKCNGTQFEPNVIPCTTPGEISELEAYEIELEENVQRESITWQERAEATKKLLVMRREADTAAGRTPQTLEEFTKEVSDTRVIDASRPVLRRDVILANHLHIPSVAEAKTPDAAMKALQRHERARQGAQMAELLGREVLESSHRLYQGDCLEVMPTLGDASYDVLISDPPYGINAQDYDDSGGKANTHSYDDSPERWHVLMDGLFREADRILKPAAHIYLFCDIDMFGHLKSKSILAGWHPFRTPLIWINPTSNRIPWLQTGPMRKWQAIFYAVRGSKPTTMLKPDILGVPSDANIGHTAQKPVELYRQLLERSCQPGDSCIDPFCGTGPLFPAASDLKLRATGIELDPSYYGMAAQRIKGGVAPDA